MSGFGFPYNNNDTVVNISTEGLGLANGVIRYTAPPRFAMWILNRNLNTSIVDDVKYIAAVGGGVWVRNTSLGTPGANFQDTWYVDFDNGDNNADGLTLSTAVKNIDEVQARWGDQVIDGSVTPSVFVHIAGNNADNHVFAPKMKNIALIFITGTRVNTPGLSGTLTTFQNWNGSTKTQCEFSWSSLPSTWTAGQFLSLPSLGNVSVVVGRDIGSKTAVSCGPVDFDSFSPINGSAVAFQGYNFNALSGKHVISPSGEGVLIFQDLELGTSSASDLHWIHISEGNAAQVSFIGCRLYGVDTYNVTLSAAVGCYIVGWRNYGIDLMQGNIHDSVGGAIFRVHETGFSDIIDHVLLLGVPSIDESGYLLIETDCSCYNAFSGWIVQGKMKINGSFWVRNANTAGNVLQTKSAGVVVYADATKIGATGSTPTNLYVVPGAVSGTLPLVATSRLSGIVQL